MSRNPAKPDIDVIINLLAITASDRAEILRETWYYPQKHAQPSGIQWTRVIMDLVSAQKSRINDRMYMTLTSDIMKMKYPVITRIERMGVSQIKKITMILLSVGLSAEIIADLTILSRGYVYSILNEYPEIFK